MEILEVGRLRIDEVQRAGGWWDVVAWSLAPVREKSAEVYAVDFATEVDAGTGGKAGDLGRADEPPLQAHVLKMHREPHGLRLSAKNSSTVVRGWGN